MMRAVWGMIATLVALVAAGWAGWHYLQFRSCGVRTCPPLTDRPPVRLDSGGEVGLVAIRHDGRGHLVVDYLTRHDRADRAALCTEARAVWEALRDELDTPRTERVFLGPTSPESEFLGMEYGVVPLYTCCVTTPIRADKEASGEWSFRDCP